MITLYYESERKEGSLSTSKSKEQAEVETLKKLYPKGFLLIYKVNEDTSDKTPFIILFSREK